MDNQQNPNSQRPMLKKVKRPINRMPMQQPQMAAESRNTILQQENTKAPNQYQQSSMPSEDSSMNKLENPFINSAQTEKNDNFADDAFNLDKYLDEEIPNSLPAVGSTNYNNSFSDDDEVYESQNTNYQPSTMNKTVLIFMGIALLFIGVIIGKLFFNSAKVVRNGLQGVVVNQEIPRGRARCGVAERNQGCVLYIMNPQRQDTVARDFYDLAAQMTGRQRFVIETGNMRYSNTKIRPGDIVQLNIPPL